VSQRIYLLDTSVILPLVRGNALGRYIDQRFGLGSATQRPFVSVVSLGRVRVLARRNDWGGREAPSAFEGARACAKAAGATLLTTDNDRLRGLECMAEDPVERCWQWLYRGETKALRFATADYDDVPKERQPIILGRIRFPKSGGMTLSLRPTPRHLIACKRVQKARRPRAARALVGAQVPYEQEACSITYRSRASPSTSVASA
jgi:hypothetical protein